MTSTVFVIQEPSQSRDFSSANKYGRIEFLLGYGERVSLLPAKSLGILRRKLKDFKSEDYIVWAGGDPFAPILAGVVLGEFGFQEINFLRWERDRNTDNRSGFYIPGKLMLRNIVPSLKGSFDV